MCTSSSHTCYVHHPFSFSSYDHSNNIWWGVCITVLLHPPVTSSHLVPNIFLNTLFSTILSLCPSLNMSKELVNLFWCLAIWLLKWWTWTFWIARTSITSQMFSSNFFLLRHSLVIFLWNVLTLKENTWLHTSEDSSLHIHRCYDLQSHRVSKLYIAPRWRSCFIRIGVRRTAFCVEWDLLWSHAGFPLWVVYVLHILS